MKRIIKYGLILSMLATGMVSCKKALDLNPSHSADGEVIFNRIEDYEFALTGTYARLLQNSYYGSTNGANAFVGLPDMMSDNLFESSESLANYQNFSRWNYVADDPLVNDIWLDVYRVVQQANLTLRGIDKLAAGNPGAVNRIKAQALALRALAHFDLLRYFGEQYDRNSTARGLAYVDQFDIEQKPARLNVKQTYDRIEADFKAAKTLMLSMDKSIQGNGTSGTDRSYIDDMVVNGFLARMYLYANSLDSAVKYSTLVINARPLASRTVFPNIWLDASTSEVIWSVKFEAFNTDIGANIFYSVGNRASYRPTTNLLALYDQVNDVRYTSYYRNLLRGAARTTSPARLVMIKYDARQSTLLKPDGIVNFKALRTGEMYLIRAEAYARLGGANEASGLADLNALRTARINGYVPVVLTGSPLLQAIDIERRKELAGEGHRFFDSKRGNRTINRTTNCTSFCTLVSSAREWAMPVPQSEILANPNAEQNDGY
ncbi:MAG: RagB/SusD family nutrient uptake outer membrane protein [Chitinophagaceae bacterium]|nr:RagB/SusD family nutrient uptake outer membrane protein [Chitinophagaceae bacterium]